MKRAVLALITLLMLVSVSAFSQSVVPQTINFQGRLAKPDGTPVADGNYTLTFTLYDALTGGNSLWTQTLSANTHNGTFAVLLGTGTNGTQTGPLNASLFGGNRWLQIKINNDAPLSPRQSFTSTAYAFRSNTAELALTVASGSITLDSLATGVLNFSNIGGLLTGSQIASGTITNDKLASGGSALTATQQAILGKFSLGVALGTASVTPTGAYPNYVAVSGNYAYIVNSNSNTLQIFDVTNPARPVLLNAPGTMTGSQPYFLTISGKYAFVTNHSGNTLQIFDVSNPAAPALVNGANGTATGSGPNQCVISGSYAYIACSGNNTLQIFNISNLANPILVNGPNGTPAGNYTDFLDVAGNYVYVTNNTGNTLQIFDVSTPAAPVLKSTTTTGGGPYQILISGNYAYIVNSSSKTLQVFNISNPSAPVLVNGPNGTATGALPVNMTVSGSVVYVTNGNSNTLQIFDVTNPASPVLTNTLATEASPRAVTVSGGNIYLVNAGSNTLQIFNTTSALNLAGTLNVSGDVNANGTVRANGVALSSDARYKTNISTLNNALDDVLNLRGVSYDFDREKWPTKNFPEGRQIGFIAQELEKVFPELVQTDVNGYKSVMYQNVVPVLVEAVKTQQKQIDALRVQVEILQGQVKDNAALKTRLETLEALVRKLAEPGH